MIVLTGLALMPALAGCESPQTKAAHKIADALPSLIGPARHYDVSVQGSAFALARGHTDEVTVTGEDVQVAPDTVLDTVRVEAHGVSFNTNSHRVTQADDVELAATVGQANLSRYVQAHNASLPGLMMVLRGSSVVVTLPIRVLGLQTHASVSGGLAPDSRNAAAVGFTADRASLGILPVPAELVNAALQLVGPVFDLSSLRFPVRVTQVAVVNSQIVLQGTANLADEKPLSAN